MLRKELSLIINSLLVQFAAGIFIVMALFRILVSPENSDITAKAAVTGMMFTGPVIMLSMAVSLFHLGNPLRAYRAVTNLGSSWLSREILFTGAFLLLWSVFMFSEINGKPDNFIIILTGFTGILSVISMAGIYYSTGKSGWYSINTYTDFLGSIVIFGCISFSAVMIIYAEGSLLTAGLVNKAGIILLAVTAIKFIQTLILISALKHDPDEWNMDKFAAGETSSIKWTRMFRTLTLTGFAVSISGGILFMLGSVSGAMYNSGLYIYISVLLIIAGETISRSGFYSLGIESEEKDSKAGLRHDAYGRYVAEKR
jgi:anaerobic dimethyl sulfoxide reductase subunit C (anchor subunit)